MVRKKRVHWRRLVTVVLAGTMLFCTGCTSFQNDTEKNGSEPVKDDQLQIDSVVENICETDTEAVEERTAETIFIDETGVEPSEEISSEEIASKEISSEEIYSGDRVEEILNGMSIEQKVAQLFFITPDALTGVGSVTASGEMTREALQQYPVGGLIYFENNLLSREQTQGMLSSVQEFSREITGLPLFLGVDEEGGSVSRISGRGFGVPDIEDMAQIGAAEDYDRAEETGRIMGGYLHELGFNMDFAPCADVLTNPENTVVARRSFGSDANLVADMISRQICAMQQEQICAVPKHFPGHGATSGDSHNGYAYTDKSLEELYSRELIPFQRAIDERVQMIMVGHIACPNVTGSDIPASLSEYMITNVLRTRMGFQGLVITDALNMGAIQEAYTSAQAAITALHAGVDLLLMPADFQSAYYGVIQAVNSGEISEERIDESVRRIIRLKLFLEK